MDRKALERKVLIKRELQRRKRERASNEFTVYGIYSKTGELLRCWQDQTGKRDFKLVDKEPTCFVMEKLEPLILEKCRVKLVFGGRGSGKSETVGGILVSQAKDYKQKTCCFREYQNSIEDSVHALLKGKINQLGLLDFNPGNTNIEHRNGSEFKFRGLSRNPDGIKSMFGFKRFWGEEAQATSQNSLTLLTPTLREEGSEIWFTMNRMSSEDPICQKYIKPFEKELLKNGIYKDDMHLIIEINHDDNPWFPKTLDQERRRDKVNMPPALYRHVWEGDYNDSVENALIEAEWFDACIDAHKKLGFKPIGARFASHDPSDTGPDDKGFALRHGSVIEIVDTSSVGTINQGGDWATGKAIQLRADRYTWDCDGMGVGLARQTDKAFEGKSIDVSMFKGSEAPDNPDAIYNPVAISGIKGQKTNKEVFKNKRAQYYVSLRDRVYNTYRAVIHGEYHDPEELISFSSEIEILSQLRAELCRIPLKPNANGLIQLYTKDEMRRLFNIPSPNAGDSVMMLMRNHVTISAKPYIPRPVQVMGAR